MQQSNKGRRRRTLDNEMKLFFAGTSLHVHFQTANTAVESVIEATHVLNVTHTEDLEGVVAREPAQNVPDAFFIEVPGGFQIRQALQGLILAIFGR